VCYCQRAHVVRGRAWDGGPGDARRFPRGAPFFCPASPRKPSQSGPPPSGGGSLCIKKIAPPRAAWGLITKRKPKGEVEGPFPPPPSAVAVARLAALITYNISPTRPAPPRPPPPPSDPWERGEERVVLDVVV
jgi:hypothetical protein